MLRPGSKHEVVELEHRSRPHTSRDDRPTPLESPQVQGKVDAIIHEGFTDLWLLITGEEMPDYTPRLASRDGRAFAMFYDGQLRLLESKPSALEALYTVGVELF